MIMRYIDLIKISFLVLITIYFITGCSKYDISDLKIGDIISFGNYEQDNDFLNGMEPIEWIVLSIDKENKTVLLLSKYGLNCKPYNNREDLGLRFSDENGNLHLIDVDVTWESSTLRKWLNENFYTEAFTIKEQMMIKPTLLDSKRNPEWFSWSGGETLDKVFLLSLDDLTNTEYGFSDDYIYSDDLRICYPTEYCFSIGKSKFVENYKKDNMLWWIRLTGRHGYEACVVNPDGTVRLNGVNVFSENNVAVSPSIVINID